MKRPEVIQGDLFSIGGASYRVVSVVLPYRATRFKVAALLVGTWETYPTYFDALEVERFKVPA